MLEDGALNVNSGNGVSRTTPIPTTGRSRSSPGTPARRRMAASSLNTNGSFVYTPLPDYNGTDSFTYEAFDGAARVDGHCHDHHHTG